MADENNHDDLAGRFILQFYYLFMEVLVLCRFFAPCFRGNSYLPEHFTFTVQIGSNVQRPQAKFMTKERVRRSLPSLQFAFKLSHI